MRKGFIFSHNKCVNCGACSAACILENGWSIHPRVIFTYNSDTIPSLPLTNLSLACNHCETPVCLNGCPTASYYREPLTGAVIIDEKKCIGCKYCQWNCPYDAPKFDTENRIIGKCNLCYSGLIEGRLPACTTACPSGALEYGELSEPILKNIPSWFPDKNLNPAIVLKGKQNNDPLRIIPENVFEPEVPKLGAKERGMAGEWSLFAFSFLTTLSVATIISSFINGIFPEKILFVSIIILAGIISLFHLGKRLRAWRAIANVKSSPLSREIALFIIYSVVSFFAVFFQLPGFLLASSIVGLILLIVIDSVYIYADKRKSVIMHSGQTFLSALLIVSFFTGIVLPFIFIALIKLAASAYSLSINKINNINFVIRFLRIALLLVTGVSLVSEISYPDPVISLIFLTGELIDRIIFYIDFSPVNINTEIIKQINIERNEKKRG
ncbi:MAG: dimethyl sulfoxide reductase anchor subunit [Bacteroidetes bacterium]|nr:dimethyl sulfoxide reductase anchor subunit [Bacteroidota bacterium]